MSFQVRFVVDPSGGRFRYPAGTDVRAPSGRRAGGLFMPGGSPEFRTALRESNRTSALELQAEVLDNLRSSIIRRNVSSGRLYRVTGDSRNRQWDDFGYAVGVENFLDNSIAKYWRQIEEGYEGHVGRPLKGLWGASITSIRGDRVYAGGPWHRHSPRRSDMFVPAVRFRSPETGRFTSLDEDDEPRKAPNFAKTTTIKNPIEAHNFYSDARATFQPGRRALADVTAIIDNISRLNWRASQGFVGRY